MDGQRIQVRTNEIKDEFQKNKLYYLKCHNY